jgi:type II restriction enzyme
MLVDEIATLQLNHRYSYISGMNTIQITQVRRPEGPITFTRTTRSGAAAKGNISASQLARIAIICQSKPNYPIHIDRVFSAGGNSRSALETLLAYTPHFFMCNPERIDVYSGEVKRDQKHIMWCPDESHPLGQIAYKDYSRTITEQETSIEFGDIQFPAVQPGDEFDSIDARRTHVQMQVALIAIGNALKLKTWIAKNDHAVTVGNTKLVDLPGVIRSLDEIRLFFDDEIKQAAALIDCIWFTQDGRDVPAVIEIEHSTGVTSGMTRMLKFRRTFPAIQPVFTIVAPNTLRAKVIGEVQQPIYADLKARYMPYSNVREIYGLLQRYSLSGIVDYRFITAFMEQII